MHVLLPISLTMLVLASACSSSSTSTDNNQSQASLLPTTLSNRIISIESDIGIDGSIDVIATMAYDAQGRISKRTDTYETVPGRGDRVTDFLYSAGKLVEKRANNALEMMTYANDLLVGYQFTDIAYEEQKSFRYDDNGRLIGTSGDTKIYSAFDCYNDTDVTGGPGAEAETEPDLIINYASNRLSSITSADGILNETYTYDAAGRITKVTSSYSCPDSANSYVDVLEFNYNNKGIPISVVQTTAEEVYRAQVTLDESDRPIKIVSSFTGTETNLFDSVDTQIITYNEQGLPSSLESSTVPPSQFSPDSLSTITYEAQSCVVALSANPLSKVTAAAIISRPQNNDPALCLFPLDDRGF